MSRAVSSLVGAAPRAYPWDMTARFLRLLILLALTLMPLRMVGPAPAIAAGHHAAAMASHCPDQPRPANHGTPGQVDCMTACAALPATSHDLPRALAPMAPPCPLPLAFGPGIAPGADPPPPRFS